MSKETDRFVEEQYDSLTRLAPPGDWPRATDELEDNTTFAEGVVGEQIAHYYPHRNSHVKGSGWSFYLGAASAEYDYYIVCDDHPQKWTAFGCSQSDFEEIQESFEKNPFLLSEFE